MQGSLEDLELNSVVGRALAWLSSLGRPKAYTKMGLEKGE